jgi:hypothetical protein
MWWYFQASCEKIKITSLLLSTRNVCKLQKEGKSQESETFLNIGNWELNTDKGVGEVPRKCEDDNYAARPEKKW